MATAETKQLLTVGLILVAAVLGGWYVVDKTRSTDPLQDRHLLRRGDELPCLWIYVNESEVNSRFWTDFGARGSRVLNVPMLNLCYESCVKANGTTYRVEVIGGLSDLAVRLGGWGTLPTPLQNKDAVIREPELNWIRAAVLAKWGGLWVDPATIWLNPVGELPKDRLVFFGSDDEVSFVGSAGTPAPSLRVIWSPAPEMPSLVAWEARARARLDARGGGSEFRRDSMSDAVDALRACARAGTPAEVRPTAELTRKGSAGRRIELEDLLAAGQEGVLPFAVTEDTIYVPLPWPEVKERRAFGWFLRMSEEQVLESDLAVSHLFRKGL